MIRLLSPPGRAAKGLTALALPLSILWGCQSLTGTPTSQPAERIDRIEQTQAGIAARVEEIETEVTGIKSEVNTQGGDVAALKNEVSITKNKSIINDVWPWLLTGLGSLMVLVAGCLLLVRMWVRKNSYLRQKPVWERKKLSPQGSSGTRYRDVGSP